MRHKEVTVMLMKAQRERITSTIRNWESIEKQSAEAIEQVKAKCANPLICLVMDIIANDARMHEKLQELIVGSLEREPLGTSSGWDMRLQARGI